MTLIRGPSEEQEEGGGGAFNAGPIRMFSTVYDATIKRYSMTSTGPQDTETHEWPIWQLCTSMESSVGIVFLLEATCEQDGLQWLKVWSSSLMLIPYCSVFKSH